jgi:hypothetical protein
MVADAKSVTELRRQFQSERYYRNLLAELAGQEESRLPKTKNILAPDFDVFTKLYEARLKVRRNELVETDD